MIDTPVEFIELEDISLAYCRYGQGNRIFLAFHGYGQTKSVYKNFHHALNDASVFSFDLFYHGDSKWTTLTRKFDHKIWKQLLSLFLDKHNIKEFSLIGFSLGGKLVMSTVYSFHSQIKNIILIAPDGIKTNPWYNLATYPILFRSIFRWSTKHPKPLFLLMKITSKLGWVEKSVIKFAKREMDNEVKRNRVYNSWIVYRHIHNPLSDFIKILNKNSVHVDLFLGKYDPIMTEKNMAYFSDHVDDLSKYTLESGHNMLIRATIEYLNAR